MKKKIQIVEDETSLSAPIANVLTKAGYHVFVESNGDKAISVIEANKPDLVLLDIMLPGKTGWDIIDVIGGTYKVIIMSNLDSPTRRLEFSNAGAVDYIVKSNISLKDIVKRVDKLFA